MEDSTTGGAFNEVLQSEVILVRCRGCNTDQPVNKAYAAYLNGGIESCRHCRNNNGVSPEDRPSDGL